MLANVSINFVNLDFQIENLGKSFSIYGFKIAYYGMIIALAISVGIILTMIEAKRTGQDQNIYIDFAIYAIIFSIIGLNMIIESFRKRETIKKMKLLEMIIFGFAVSIDSFSIGIGLEIINLRKGGLAIYGGIIFAVVTCIVYSKAKKLSFWKIVDTASIGLLAGQIIGRWGNFFNREAFGGYTDNIFAMQLKLDEVGGVITQSLKENIVINGGIEYIQVHPTFLYESMWNLLILILILILKRYKKFDGEVFLWYIGGYALGRAWIEGLRTDQLLIPLIELPVSQVLSILIVIVVVIVLFYKRLVYKKNKLSNH